MHTRRLVRQLLAHGGLAYALVGFLGGLVWLSVTASRPAIEAPATSAGPRPLTAPVSGQVPLQDAIDSVRRFTGQPSMVLEGSIQTDAPSGTRGDLYYLESVSPTRGEDFFKVDARTGEVIEATLRGRMAPAIDAVDLSLPAAETVATRFAQARFWGFDQLTLVDRSSRTSENGTIFSFKWSQLAADSGAELPTSVSVAVSGRSGQVFWYLGQREPRQIETQPAVSQARAIEIAQAWLQPRDARWNLSAPTSVRLQVLYDDDDQQQLVWSVQFRARQEGQRSSLRLLVDAQSGQIIQSAS
ncbi:MAG: PepSY domain-containing protein [Chloroflexota bacterium]